MDAQSALLDAIQGRSVLEIVDPSTWRDHRHYPYIDLPNFMDITLLLYDPTGVFRNAP
jgi:hypothetical protein